MMLKGKRTYIVALCLAIVSIAIWYRTHDDTSLTGLFSSISMIGMRKITGKTIISECEQIFNGVNKMGINYGKAIQDSVLLITDALALEQALAGNPDLLNKFNRVKDDALAIVADLETSDTPATPK